MSISRWLRISRDRLVALSAVRLERAFSASTFRPVAFRPGLWRSVNAARPWSRPLRAPWSTADPFPAPAAWRCLLLGIPDALCAARSVDAGRTRPQHPGDDRAEAGHRA